MWVTLMLGVRLSCATREPRLPLSVRGELGGPVGPGTFVQPGAVRHAPKGSLRLCSCSGFGCHVLSRGSDARAAAVMCYPRAPIPLLSACGGLRGLVGQVTFVQPGAVRRALNGYASVIFMLGLRLSCAAREPDPAPFGLWWAVRVGDQVTSFGWGLFVVLRMVPLRLCLRAALGTVCVPVMVAVRGFCLCGVWTWCAALWLAQHARGALMVCGDADRSGSTLT